MLYKYLVGLSLCVFAAMGFASEVRFVNGSHTLVGQYLAPTDNQPVKAVILFVHGDGATTFNSDGYYDLIWSSLRARGYAIFSWDKPGVGQSTGNWLTQSMLDRQNEVHAAVETMQQKYGFTAKQTGLFGFSQAGWVVPALAHDKNKISFVIGVGFATNWGQQGQYYTKTQHQRAGNDDNQIANAVKDYANEVAFLATSPSYDAYLTFLTSQSNANMMTKERFQFVTKNVKADASEDYLKIAVPSLFLWGQNDLNVDAKFEFAHWQSNPHTMVTTHLIPTATHAMLDSDKFTTQQFGFKEWLKMQWYEEKALAPDFLPTILDWLNQVTM